MTSLQQSIANMISYYIDQNDDSQGLAHDLGLYIANHVDDAGVLAREIESDVASCREMDKEDVRQ